MAQYLPQKPAATPLIAALAANSYFLYGNIGVMTAGIIPYVLDQSSSETVKATNWFIERGKVRSPCIRVDLKTFVIRSQSLVQQQNTFFATAIASSALFGSAAYYASEPRVQQLSTVAAVSMFGVLPWTVAFMLPINRSLEEMGTGGTKALEGKEEKAVEKVKMWRARHMMRMVLGTIGWVAGIAALEIL